MRKSLLEHDSRAREGSSACHEWHRAALTEEALPEAVEAAFCAHPGEALIEALQISRDRKPPVDLL